MRSDVYVGAIWLRFEIILAPFLVDNRPGSSEIAVEGPPEVQTASLERSGALLE